MPTPEASAHHEADIANVGGSTKRRYVSKNLGGQLAPAYDRNLHPKAQASLAGTGISFATRKSESTRRHHSRHNSIGDRNSTGEPSWKELPPALFEANESRRAEKYKTQDTRFDEVHDQALFCSMVAGMPLLENWEGSKQAYGPIGKKRPRKTDATIKNARNQPPLEGEGRKLSLSPVFPIRPPAPEDGAVPLDLDGSGVWPIDLPKPRIGRPPLPHVPIRWPLSPRMRLPIARRSTHGKRRRALRERFLSGHNHVAKKEESMTEEEMSVFVDFDAKR
ncbi:hypothetical protein P171DRAFT_435289 [Karstenula rhodostoma CBS 690.94]|uniref:Uncharacterized protein n=1 Tax=Karstenula rhodostoma CBS 690.94 TaxID=1392251 RepID=A0A9P4PAX6_9PLEO|nr:hypothetical protein P171DRAFT_435289 [Karstenula rhodostoma CBS 690.94]